MMTIRRAGFLGAAMCLAASGAAGRSSVQPASAGAPVTIAFRAFTPGGEPVLDLKASDLTLKVNGRARGIESLDLVRLADDRAESSANPAPPPFTTNVLSERARTVLIILEDDSIAPGQEEPVKKALEQVLAPLSPADRVALLPTARASAITAFSTDREAVRAAIAGFAGRASVRESMANVPCRTRITLEALRQMFAGLPAEFPVTVVFFSAGLSGPIDSLPAIGTQPLCELRLDEFTDVADVILSTSNFFYVAYVVEGSGLAASASSFLATGLETLAGAGGGDTIRVTGGNEAAMTRIARETASYYALTFVPDPSDSRNPRWRLDLSTERGGVRLRAPAARVRADGQRRSRTSGFSPRELLRIPDASRDLPLRAAHVASRDPGDAGKVKLVVFFEPGEPSTYLTSAAVGLFDEKSRLTAQWTGDEEKALRAPPIASALVAPPGRYRLRVAAGDASGRTGTLDEELRLGLNQAGPLTLSDLVLGTDLGAGFVPRLQFSSEASVMGYFEIYGVPGSATVAATLEIAVPGSGQILGSTPAVLRPAGGAPDVRLALAGFPLEALPTGDYLMRATVTVDGQPAGRLQRTLRKVGP